MSEAKPIVRMVRIKSLRLPGDLVARSRTDEIRELAGDIAVNGLIHPVTVNATTKELICGRDRVAAHLRLKRTHIAAIMVEVSDSVQVKRLTIAENLRRRQDNRTDLLAAYAALETIEVRAKDLAELMSMPEDVAKAKDFDDVEEETPVERRTVVTKETLPRGPKKTVGAAREKVAAVAGVTPEAVRSAQRRAASKKAEKPEAPVEPSMVIRTFGNPVPSEIVEAAKEAQGIVDAIDRHLRAALREMSRLEPYKIAAQQRLYQQIRQAGGGVRHMRPDAVCPWCKGLSPSCESCGGRRWLTVAEMQNVPAEQIAGAQPAASEDEELLF